VAFLGVSVRTAYEVDYPHEVTIDSGQVGGPSAGLAFTLGVIDLLTPGDLTGGTEITATGTIRPDGSVGAIGGVQQKAAAVRRAGVRLFLVPAEQTPEELARARELAGKGVEIVPVKTLDEALDVLATRGGEEIAMPGG
jgi:PDZ domain-containing protein